MSEIEEKARTKTTQPAPSREKGQRSLDLPLYLRRYIPYWGMPTWMNGNAWRTVVSKQPIATICRETLIANLVDLDWKIEPTDSTKRDELKDDIDYYSKLFEKSKNYDYVTTVEWITKDMLDLPFGGAAEILREGDRPEGRVLDYILLDGATLFPSLNSKHPVGQYIPELGITKHVYFPKYAIDRIYYSPRTDIKREGWGMAPPELIYLALELINRGDVYYANLLLDTPQTGILDLGDMSADSAEEWVTAWRELLTGIDPFKIPVLYAHDKEAKFIPFQKSPVEIMYDKTIYRYTTIITAGYGMTPGDIGVAGATSGGDTLAGTIRQERRTKRTGFARAKKKIKGFFDAMLPDTLRFHFIDLDDELSVALGRARLASFTAIQEAVKIGILSPEEGRMQLIKDGLITISIPETIPPDAQPMLGGGANERPGMLGRPVSPSEGGHGEVVESDMITKALGKVRNIDGVMLERLAYSAFPKISIEVSSVYGEYEDAYERDAWLNWRESALMDGVTDEIPELTSTILAQSMESIHDSLDRTGAKLFDLDVEKASDELLEFASDIVCEYDLREANRMFVKSEIDSIDDALPTDVADLEAEINELVADFYLDAEMDVAKAIISGVYKFCMYHPEVEGLEDANPDLILFIRDKIDKVCDKLLLDVAQEFSDIIKAKLEKEVIEDASKTNED